MLGHAGWTSGQLEKEIENGDWLMQSTSIDFVFNTNESKMWQFEMIVFLKHVCLIRLSFPS